MPALHLNDVQKHTRRQWVKQPSMCISQQEPSQAQICLGQHEVDLLHVAMEILKHKCAATTWPQVPASTPM